MRDFQAGCIKRLKNASLNSSSKQTNFGLASSCALPFKTHCSSLPPRRPSRPCLVHTLTLQWCKLELWNQQEIIPQHLLYVYLTYFCTNCSIVILSQSKIFWPHFTSATVTYFHWYSLFSIDSLSWYHIECDKGVFLPSRNEHTLMAVRFNNHILATFKSTYRQQKYTGD